ncbi:bifunctional 5,10-methylenetetrahydrofolate dehydrogenase/5,10-methenyltetrahydrofolate cyclohydrolase [Paenarthrobacter nicotinovorans]|uniref:bifunctional 5,10-methylenetetrahydrofolate dehydrogenase/5,10-methenyltetrahydrofolate cyclohydrolase n=1 Tax=Paenarthrobacter nicotinovorans TaxID=29320 RepID=UPI001664F618|nr:bifunctional 5,10-methylenetetrahydrofolate dehydrogenase/5,10-methenyltetrahydrofolate cyclohydrolase [Paenarthrobacter nicotinovorans]MBP2394135.1 methylenetetrahydrofolate dehydrogenase (NADP+)/methenyltetrahydrofolate cyclohydrolase [Paenarthrobacter nicotinovorans]UKE99653.1 bifunctional 5,10-methylenetetrahydrofolate dehydrogenase/5,10-methenyltetrahydrofolate cyclohydrolase [Paenarthrobacter nicotinovorans]UKF04437.1 bifunctional 5,10-methylenetetrahydrofolate dehydrogenase/5,10-methen
MNTQVLSGKQLATLIQQRAGEEARALENSGRHPVLAVVVATDDESTLWYVRSIERAAERLGIGCRIVDLGPEATEQVLASVLGDLSTEPSVNGIILQTPLPVGVKADSLVGLIAPEKDIDGANPLSLGRLAVGQPAFAPATAQAVVELLDHFDVPVAGRNVAVVGRSAVVGKPLALLLLERDATVTICHSRSGPLERYTLPADVVVVAAGRTGLLKGSHISPETVVVDVGTNVLPDGSLVGDVDEASVTGIAAGLTPVPGGVGSVTTALLLLHTVEAARQQEPAQLATATSSARI